MQIEGMFAHSTELCQPNFTESSEVFNSVDMVTPVGKALS